ncbi:uncharacterized protein VTP21DRAFT_8042 [Calcarisporiella thermophila]|uniref:uncharacterized protein n=1 Tax=Calcarisporiella thermophila TaxID=911321 RepID=UPI00374258DF
MAKISESVKSRIISLARKGRSSRKISELTGVSTSTIYKYRNQYLPQSSAQSSGRSRKLPDKKAQRLVRNITSSGVRSEDEARQILKEKYDAQVSINLLRSALQRAGVESRSKKPPLRESNKKARLAFARKYKNWTVEDWKKVVWSGKFATYVPGTYRSIYYYARPNDPPKFRGPDTPGGDEVCVWGCITSKGVGFMCRIEEGLDAELYQRILEDELMRTLEWYDLSKDQVIFQQSNAPTHVARSTMEWIEENGITLLDWPSMSPDLNPIESIWAKLTHLLENREQKPSSIEELWDAIQELWEKIEPEFCVKAIETMPQRIKDVLEARGGRTSW